MAITNWARMGAAVALLACVPRAGALQPAEHSLDAIVNFEAGSSLVNEVEAAKIAAAVERIRAARWCSVRVATVVGYAGSSEATAAAAQALSHERAVQVALQLVASGLKPSLVYTEGQGLRKLDSALAQLSNAHARVEIVGAPPHPGCAQQPGGNGLWR